jgi:hypothetical protein
MRKTTIATLLCLLSLLLACSPRDYLTRNLASDLIESSDAFKATQRFWLRTGAISNKDYVSPQYLVLQRHGWINASNVPCPSQIGPPPCWDVALTPLGVETFRNLMQGDAAGSNYFSVPAARRQLLSISGISKVDSMAEVDFVWKWSPMNDVGTAFYGDGVQYTSTVGFKKYDDGWRVMESTQPKHYPSMDEALKDAASSQ